MTVYGGINSGGIYRGSAFYTHASTTLAGTVFFANASFSGAWTQEYIGTTVGNENPGCVAAGHHLGEHLHQRAYWENVASSSRNTGVYPTFVNDGGYYIDVKGYHQDRAFWYQ